MPVVTGISSYSSIVMFPILVTRRTLLESKRRLCRLVPRQLLLESLHKNLHRVRSPVEMVIVFTAVEKAEVEFTKVEKGTHVSLLRVPVMFDSKMKPLILALSFHNVLNVSEAAVLVAVVEDSEYVGAFVS